MAAFFFFTCKPDCGETKSTPSSQGPRFLPTKVRELAGASPTARPICQSRPCRTDAPGAHPPDSPGPGPGPAPNACRPPAGRCQGSRDRQSGPAPPCPRGAEGGRSPETPALRPDRGSRVGAAENGCEGTSPSAELRFQHSASPPSATSRFPRRGTLPPRLPRALPPAAAPPRPRPCRGPARGPGAPRPPLREPAERAVGHARRVWRGSGLFAVPGLPRAGIPRAAKVPAGLLPTVFPQAPAKRDFSGLPLFKAPSVPHVEVSHPPECSLPAPRFFKKGKPRAEAASQGDTRATGWI
ncbi:PREDICTED: basic proline-rich protein-like [Hipposideros armiger]|uniref:Basic proline-rich protein-like n=1 Tax=Hipposideros armiger TaxID=186990 RepID=A0A8B7S460_HIPAR|nr:PREDICTED: basic proline-rich protein-like [Hipposideros armiger]